MPNKIEKILEQVLMRHHDDISKQDDDAIAEATQQIKELVRGVIPTRYKATCLREEDYEAGFNSCRDRVLKGVDSL